ncbi:hypothetical protein GQ457_06G027740 [Hibiscus cannabinus]
MAEISSEVKSFPMENDGVNRNPGEFKRLVVEKGVLAGHQVDVNGDENQDGQQIQLLASQENEGPSTPVKINDDHVAGNGFLVREKPILMVTNESKPRLRWTYELHDYFLEAVNRIGGPKMYMQLLPCISYYLEQFTEFLELPLHSAVAAEATPKAILKAMDIDGLEIVHVKSHLQKFRLGNFKAKDWQDTSKNASQRLGGPQSLRPLSSVQSQTTRTTEHNRRPRAPPRAQPRAQPRAKRARNSEKGRHEPLSLQLQTLNCYRRYLEAQRCLNTTLYNQHSGSAAMGNVFFYRQPLASLGTFTTMPGPSAFGTVATLPQFHFNQHYACRPICDAPTSQATGNIQEVPFRRQPQTSLYTAPASSNQESLPALPSSEVEIQPDDEDPISALLNWNNDKPINLLDSSFNCNNLQDYLS